MLGAPLIALLFQRGEFDAASTAETAHALRFYAIALFAHSGLEIITRAFYAMHDTRTPVTIGVAAMGLNILLSLLLIGPLAQGGLALANSVATILEMLVLLYLLRRRLGQLVRPSTRARLGAHGGWRRSHGACNVALCRTVRCGWRGRRCRRRRRCRSRYLPGV